MTQKKKKKSVSSNRHGNLANTNASTIQKKKKKKKSIVNTKKANIYNQIIVSNGEEATQKLNLYQISKGKSIMEPSNDNTDQMDVDQVMRIHFHEEIMIEILRRLPVRSLFRFKCVSKFWKALIADPYFKMKHYIHTKNDQNSQKFLITQMLFDEEDMFNFSISSLSMFQMVEDEQKLDCPSSCKPENCKIYCSCDGLVLLLVFSDSLDKHLLLWNPSTRESILLPHPESPLIYCACGMGYDTTSDDYKILLINLNDPYTHNFSVEVLVLKSGCWRRIGYPTGFQRVRGFRDSGTDYLAFVHGAFHWLGMSLSGDYTTVSFNISNEVYGEIPFLERMFNVWPTSFIDCGVSVVKGMICFYSTFNYLTEAKFKLWVMKDYGVKESWTKLITIRDTNLFHSARPKYMFADGEVILRCKRYGCIGSELITSRGPYGLWPQCVSVKQGIAYT